MSNSRYKNIYLLKPYCLSILLIIACAISVGAKTTTSTSNGFTVTATDNVTLNGQTGILFKIKVIVPGPDNAGAWLILDICNMQGNIIKVNGKDLNTFGSIGLPYENNNFDNCELFISYSELSKGNISKSSPFKYFVTVQSKNKNKKNRQLKQSGYFEWNGSSSSPKPASKPASKQSSKPDNHKNQKSWVEKYGNITIHHTLFADGTENITTQSPCIFCHESGRCQVCYGTGQQYWRGLQCFQPCRMCGGNGKCTQCGGGKVFSTTMFRKPDGLFYDTKGRIITPRREIKGNKQNRASCPVCDGLGFYTTAMYVDDPHGASINVISQHELGHQHLSGSVCRYCGEHRYHVHVKCYKCN